MKSKRKTMPEEIRYALVLWAIAGAVVGLGLLIRLVV